MNDLALGILEQLQGGLPLVDEPFAEVADRLGISEEEVVDCLASLRADGVMRRFGARIDQRRCGLTVNAMVGWRVPQDRVGAAGRIMAADPEVTHCYERAVVPGRWEHNLFTVLHQPDRASLDRRLADLSFRTGCDDFVILESGREFKRAPAARIPATVLQGGVR